MLEQVEQKILELKKLQAEEYYRKKDEDLDAWGLTAKRNGKKTTPIVVTDDEYEALIKASNGVGKNGRNAVANTLKTAAIAIMIIAVTAGGISWKLSDSMGLVWFTLSVIIGAVIALIFYGISEAIGLLQQLIDMKPLKRPDPVNTTRFMNVNAPAAQPTAPVAPVAPAAPVAPVYAPTQQMAGQPPIYQASSNRQTAAQPYPTVPQQNAPAQPSEISEAPVFGAPQNYNETGSFENEVQDDFFNAPYDIDPNLSEYQN